MFCLNPRESIVDIDRYERSTHYFRLTLDLYLVPNPRVPCWSLSIYFYLVPLLLFFGMDGM